MNNTPPVCDYTNSDYQSSFWDQADRAYEDAAEAVALRRMLPSSGRLLLELGAGAGRNSPRYAGYGRVVLVDYSRTQLEQACARLGAGNRYMFVAADVYKLPFVDALFDGATMIRTLHHMADAPKALTQVRDALSPGAVFILEFANKLNLKSILRYWLGRQDWNPFSLEPVEFVKLNFDFHPKAVRNWLWELGFSVEKTLAVSHFRLGILKRAIPAKLLAALDGLFQPTGALWQLTPSVFVRAKMPGDGNAQNPIPVRVTDLFKCPDCGSEKLEERESHLHCPQCKAKWALREGIYDFREKL